MRPAVSSFLRVGLVAAIAFMAVGFGFALVEEPLPAADGGLQLSAFLVLFGALVAAVVLTAAVLRHLVRTALRRRPVSASRRGRRAEPSG